MTGIRKILILSILIAVPGLQALGQQKGDYRPLPPSFPYSLLSPGTLHAAQILPNRALDLPGISPSVYMSNLGFFCKEEIRVQAFTHLGIKIRLGSSDYTDYMEGKTTALLR